MKLKLSPIRAARALIAAGRVVRDPRRLDEVLRMTSEFATPENVALVESRLARTSWGATGMRERPRLGKVDLRALEKLPEGTLGRSYAHHMLDNGLDPRALTDEADRTTSYLRAHMLEAHDIWHVVTGFGTDVAGELGLQGFYLGNFPIGGPPLAITALGLVHALVYQREESDRIVREVVRGYLLGRRAHALFGADWKALWLTPVAELRTRFAIDADGVERALAPHASDFDVALAA